jgi:hypothetical protein
VCIRVIGVIRGVGAFNAVPTNPLISATIRTTRTMRVTMRRALVAVVSLAVAAETAPAQAGGVVVGMILDHTNRVGLDGVIVTIAGTDLLVATDRNGNFAIGGVPLGARELEARRPGYASFKLAPVHVAARDTARVIFSMTLEAVRAVDVTWSTNASQYRGSVGQPVSFRCPPGGAPRNVWGTDIYTDDSSVCTAAVHAGRITVADGGVVTFEMRPGLGAYSAAVRNGIESSAYEAWQWSFVFR